MSLIPIPWQPNIHLTPDTLALLVAASDRLKTQLRVASPDGGWRAYAAQKKYYDAYRAYVAGRGPKSPPASNPDTGNRFHMRGAAFDLVRSDAAAQAACRAVGLVRDPVESWHWNNPRWASMPIIFSNTNTASTNSKPIAAVPDPIKEDEEMYLVIDKGTPQKPSTGTYVVNAEGCTGISAGVESSLMRLFKVDRSEILLLMKTEIEELDGFLRANARLNR